MRLNLVPLKIPRGWAVLYNSFSSEEPVIENGEIVNDQYYQQDLLSISQMKYRASGWSIDKQGILFDLGWYPEGSPKGLYRLVVLRGNWDNIIVSLESKKKSSIAKAINEFMGLLNAGGGDSGLQTFAQILAISDSELNLTNRS